jgi:hypothetical protein
MAAKEVDMKHADVDASLRNAEPLLESLDDGFSPPAESVPEAADAAEPDAQAQPALGPQTAF